MYSEYCAVSALGGVQFDGTDNMKTIICAHNKQHVMSSLPPNLRSNNTYIHDLLSALPMVYAHYKSSCKEPYTSTLRGFTVPFEITCTHIITNMSINVPAKRTHELNHQRVIKRPFSFSLRIHICSYEMFDGCMIPAN